MRPRYLKSELKGSEGIASHSVAKGPSKLIHIPGLAASGTLVWQVFPVGVVVTFTVWVVELQVRLVALKVGVTPGAEHTTCPSAVGAEPAAKLQVLPAAQGRALPATRVVVVPPSL